jgi:hypothetical protein
MHGRVRGRGADAGGPLHVKADRARVFLRRAKNRGVGAPPREGKKGRQQGMFVYAVHAYIGIGGAMHRGNPPK